PHRGPDRTNPQPDRGVRARRGGAPLGEPPGRDYRGAGTPQAAAAWGGIARDGVGEMNKRMARRALRGVPLLTCVRLFCGFAGAGEGPTILARRGSRRGARLLVIHADDLGMAHSVNRATFEALEERWITSASILVPCPWFPEAARFARAHPEADLGIHLAL